MTEILSERVKKLALAKSTAKIQLAVRVAIFEGAHSIRNSIIESMRSPKSGRLYGTHRASAPGEAPAPDTQNLVDDVRAKIANDGQSAGIGVFTGDSSEYGKYLEEGTASVLPRPWLRPAFNVNVEGIKIALKNALKAR